MKFIFFFSSEKHFSFMLNFRQNDILRKKIFIQVE